MKKTVFITIITTLVLCFWGCANSIAVPEETIDPESLSLVERINSAQTFDETAACRNRNYGSNGYYDNYFDDKGQSAIEAREAASKRIIWYMFSDQKLDNTYYYTEHHMPGTYGAEQYGTTSSDSVTIHVENENKIYIVPTDILQSKNGDFNKISNISDYIYKAVEGELPAAALGEGYLQVTLYRVTDNYELTLAYHENDGYITFYEVFPYQKNADGSDSYSYGRDYYVNKTNSQEKAEQDHAEDLENQKEKEQLKKSAPRVGMTASEVTQCSWGYPDKKNIYEYAWGTQEQWVYHGKGYVYIENGIVTSVSKSE